MTQSKPKPTKEIDEASIAPAKKAVPSPETTERAHKKTFNFKKWCIIIGVLLLILGVVYTGFFVYFASTNAFPIKNVKVMGTYEYVKPEDIQTALMPFLKNKGICAFSEWQAEKALEAMPGVADASIWRIYPDKIRVVLREKSAIARLSNGQLLAADGSFFDVTNPAGAANLPILQGETRYVKPMLAMLESLIPVFAYDHLSVTGLGLAENGDWSVQLNDQTWVMMGKQDLQNRAVDFLTIYPLLMKTAPANQIPAYIDLRYVHGLTVSWRPAPAPSSGAVAANSPPQAAPAAGTS